MSKLEVNTIEPQCGTTLTLGGSGDTVTLGSGASQSGFKAVDWVTTPKTATFTAESGKGYFCNTSGGAFNITLPASPTAGDTVALKDYDSSFSTYNLTIDRNGSKLDSASANKPLDTDNLSMTLVYVDTTQGWKSVEEGTGFIGESFIVATGGTITTSGDYKIHTFTGPGTFTVCTVATCATQNLVSYMVIAGGAAGGNGSTGGGGGGAGGYRELVSPTSPYTGSPTQGYPTPGNRITVTATGYPIAVGGGGAGVSAPNVGNAGSNSTFSTITSNGGGGGGAWSSGGAANGGSGGGQAKCGSPTAGGSGNTPPTTPAQGSDGGGKGYYQQAGGGGATAVGQDGNNPPSPATRSPTEGNGGTGATSSINGTPTQRAGGGAGGYADTSPVPGAGKATATGGGSQGGGQGSDASNATVNTGGGGGGSGNPSSSASGAGGSGIVIIRYKYQ